MKVVVNKHVKNKFNTQHYNPVKLKYVNTLLKVNGRNDKFLLPTINSKSGNMLDRKNRKSKEQKILTSD